MGKTKMEGDLVGTADVAALETTICNCRFVPRAEALFSILIEQGVRFLDPRPANPDRSDLNPQREIEKDGSIIVPLTITHSVLGRDCKYFSVGWKTPVARLGYIAESRSMFITQTNAKNSATLEEIVHGQVALAAILAPAVGAAYGWIDVTTEKPIPQNVTAFSDVKNWFFANFFGPDLVASSPHLFFEQMPAYTKIALNGGGVFVQSSATFAQWHNGQSSDLVKYLSRHAPKMRAFRG